MNKVKHIFLGETDYGDALKLQESIFDAYVEKGITPDLSEEDYSGTLLLLSHHHVITMGRYGSFQNLIVSEEILKAKGVKFFHTNRGGDITYHGPGQVVGYPILKLPGFKIGVKEYVFRLEEVIIKTLAEYQLKGERISGATGVWIRDKKGERKVCAMGIRVSRAVSMHGFALNVNTDLSYFSLMNPCGFTDKTVTSIAAEINEKPDENQVCKQICRYFGEVFQAQVDVVS